MTCQKKILVTGGNGFIGKNLLEHLSKQHVVFAPRSFELNLLDEDSVHDFLRNENFDVVIHAAGKPGHRNAKDLKGIFYADTRMFYNIVRCRDCFGKLLITGSGGIYDARFYRPKVKEESWGVHVPIDEHGFFRYVTAHTIGQMDRVVDLRLFGVFGKYEDYAIRFISNAICKAIFDLPITIKQNRRFDYLYIKDLFPIVDYFIENDVCCKEYNVTPDETTELQELAEKVVHVSGKNIPILVSKKGMGLEYSGDNGRLRKEIPHLQFTKLETAIKDLYRWYEENRTLIDRDQLLVDK
ncbi:MAG: NAD(P)-dependent oxidoreductase [Geobacteraceae bacterium]|nr:NAD(P)-dependent oxidoreductase [Geobacteraceae bacterium]